MKVVIVQVHIQPNHREQFLASMLDDARGSVNDEPGCLRFDVIQDNSDPNKIYLYEAYRDDAAFEAHRQAPHYLKWKETVKDWYTQPNIAFHGRNIFPADTDWKK
ncbi:MAG: putative quinol monooxygenase [Chloroflexota bacterium]